ncbi:MAG: metallophosphoesterase family protein [Candidatus Omnitrophota bacterium]
MRYGIFSDVHANLEAFHAALNWFKGKGVDEYIFLGDIVGYGANPCEVIELIEELEPVCIAGNHDWVFLGRIDIKSFNPHAKESILWTKKTVSSPKMVNFISGLQLVYENDIFTCVHGNISQPERFHYILNKEDAVLSFTIMQRNICFIGHSHRPEIYCLRNGEIYYSLANEVPIIPEAKYIINVGSVGQPRDKDRRGCVCLYDSNSGFVTTHRFDYDVKKAADKIVAAGLPTILAERLYVGC